MFIVALGVVCDGSRRAIIVDEAVVSEDMQDGLGGSGNGLHIGADKNMQPGSFF